ncbi:MAG: hypothetical protein OTI34_02430 [Lewinella sp.]|jgi:hypothetical protein|nr:hypothetical protein [Lewinella sp.]
MLKYLTLLLMLSFLFTCEGNTAARKVARGENFVSDPDHLYFKNTRARHYAAEEIVQRATIYRHDGLFDSEANLRPTLIDNWLQDRAIIRFDYPTDTTNWELQAFTDEAWSEVELSVPPTNEELDVLNNLLLGKEELRLSSPTGILPAFPAASGRTEARAILNDYLRLVGFAG